MSKNTKSSKRGSSHQKSDKQQFWLSILLIITCVCLITALLIISFFVYREIDRSLKNLDNATKDRYDKLKGDYKETTDGYTTELFKPISTMRNSWYRRLSRPASTTPPDMPYKYSTIKNEMIKLDTSLPEYISTLGATTPKELMEKNDSIIFPEEVEMLKPTKTYLEVSDRFNSSTTITTTERKLAKLIEATSVKPTKKRVDVKGGFLKLNETTAPPESLPTTDSVTMDLKKVKELHLTKRSPVEKDVKGATMSVKTEPTTPTVPTKYISPSEGPITVSTTLSSPTSTVSFDSSFADIKSTMPETKTYYVKTVETVPTTIIKYIEKDPPPPIKVCETITCKRSASKMIALMDHNADPCEDFYSYACRGIEVNRLKNPQFANVILDRLESIESIDANTAKFKKFYSSCTKFNKSEGLSALQAIIHDTFHMSDKGDKRDSLTKTLLKIIMMDTGKSNFGLLPIFDVAMELDTDGSFIPTITIPTLKEYGKIDKECLKNLSIAEMDEKSVQKYHERYQSCIKDISVHAGEIHSILRSLSVGFTVPESQEKVLKILESIPKSINKRNWYESIADSGKPVYFSIKDLHEKYPEINWAILLITLFKEKESKISKVRIMFKDHLEELFKFYRENSLKDLTLALRVIITYDLYTSTLGEYDDLHRREYCLTQARNSMEDLAVKLLLSKSNKKDLEQLDTLANSVFGNLKTQFNTSILNSTWISDPMKKTILAKLERLQLIADTNNLYFNEPLLDYRNGKISLTDNFIENIIRLKNYKRSLMYNKIDNNPGNMWIYEYNPLSTDVWMVPGKETIVLPQGLLLKLAFKKRRAPQLYEIYAQLGFQIGRGIASFFEPSQLKKLLPGIEENEFYKNYLHVRLGDPQIAKAINKYDLIAVKEDLLLSQDPRFADDLTIRLSLDTYNATSLSKDLQFLWLNYTIPQLFYLTVAQEFCQPEDSIADLAVKVYEENMLPNFFRINSFLMNSIGFSDAYHCPLGSTLNPALKADAFPYITYTEIDYL